MLSFKSMAIYMIKNPEYYNKHLQEQLLELIDDCLNVWHVSGNMTGVSVLNYLGLTWDEYAEYVSEPYDFMSDLIEKHSVRTG